MNDNDNPEYEYPPVDKIVMVFDADKKREVRAKRINHKTLGPVFVNAEPENGGNWQMIIMNPRAWREE